MTYEDYMKLTKESLARELERRDSQQIHIPYIPVIEHDSKPCYAPDGICTNPHHDCINCPRIYPFSPSVTKVNTTEL